VTAPASRAVPHSGPAYEALSELRGLGGSLASLEVRSAGLVERAPDGTLRVPEQSDDVIGVGTAAGGLAGMLVGVLGGPLGVLLGFGTGALVGGALDVDRASSVDSALGLLSAPIRPGSTALIVDAVETTPEPLDELAPGSRRPSNDSPAAQVAVEVDAAEAAQTEADRVLRERRRAKAKAKVGQKVGVRKEKATEATAPTASGREGA
jgi:uncharacterized membrane protein